MSSSPAVVGATAARIVAHGISVTEEYEGEKSSADSGGGDGRVGGEKGVDVVDGGVGTFRLRG